MWRYEGLVGYVAGRYPSAVEVGIGHFPGVALALLGRGVRVLATDIRPIRHDGLKVLMDDVTAPDRELYEAAALLYSLRPPPELVPYMLRLAVSLHADLIVMPLSSEHPGGRLIRHGNTSFFLWSPP
jgi:uncharacterized UPF0146 family protein